MIKIINKKVNELINYKFNHKICNLITIKKYLI